MRIIISDPGDEMLNANLFGKEKQQEDQEPKTCDICNRVIPQDIPYCEVSDCPYKLESLDGDGID